MYKGILTLLGAGPVYFTLMSCAEPAMNSLSMPTQSDGAAFFAQNCTSCHGTDAQGAGSSGAAIGTAPPDLTRLSARNGGAFPAATALSYIYGEPGNSHLARVMPQFGGTMAEDLVPVEIDGVLTPTPRELAGLLLYLESIQSP